MPSWWWLSCGLTWLLAGPAVNAVNISTPAEFVDAIRAGESSLFLVANISGGDPASSSDATRQDAWLTQAKPAPDECLASPDAFAANCLTNPELVIVKTPTVVTGLPGLYIDLAQIRRMVTLLAEFTFSNLTIYGFVTDVVPFVWFFCFAENATLVLDNCVLESPCGLQSANYMLQYIQKVDPSATFQIPGNASDYYTTRVQVQAETQLSTDTVPGSQSFQVLQNSTLVCDPSLIDNTMPMDTYVNPADTCQNASDLGFGYRGTVNVTRSGYICQNWTSQTPQFHTRLPNTYPAAGLVLNYCRNPDNSDTGAWCYTIDGPRWEGCDIPLCTPGTAASEWTASGWRLWLVLAAALLVVLCAVLAVVAVPRRRGRRHGEGQQLTSKSSVGRTSQVSGRATSLYALTSSRYGSDSDTQPFAELQAAIAAMGANDQQLLIQDVVGKGGFGVVYRGIWRGLEVAIKTVTFQDRKVAGGSAQQRAIAEAAITFSLSHPNVVATYHHDIKPLQPVPSAGNSLSVHGDVTTWKLYLVQEYCAHGSLRNAIDANYFLTRNHQPKLIQCVQCLLDIAQGVKYIHSKRIIHGDLNPSNVLLKRRHRGEAPSPRSKRPSTRDTSAKQTRVPSRGHASDAESSGSSSELASSANFCANAVGEPSAEPCVDSISQPWEFIAKVCDFGLSMKISPNQEHVSNVKQGTPFYIAPEVRAEGQLSMAADVHAFGTIMWEVWHSKAPYKVTKGQKLVKRREFPKYPRDCPLSYAVLSSSCLSANPQNRPNFWQIVGVLWELSAHLQGNVDESTRYAHITLEELDRLSSAQAANRAPDSMASTPLTQAAVALESMFMMSAPEPDIANTSDVSCAGDAQEVVPDGSAFVSLVHSMVAEDAEDPQSLVSRVFFNATRPGGALAPIADDDSSDSSLEGGGRAIRPRSVTYDPHLPLFRGHNSAASSGKSSRSMWSDGNDCVIPVARFGSRPRGPTYAHTPAMDASLHHQLIPPTLYTLSSLTSRASAPTSEVASPLKGVAAIIEAPRLEEADSLAGSFTEARSAFSDEQVS